MQSPSRRAKTPAATPPPSPPSAVAPRLLLAQRSTNPPHTQTPFVSRSLSAGVATTADSHPPSKLQPPTTPKHPPSFATWFVSPTPHIFKARTILQPHRPTTNHPANEAAPRSVPKWEAHPPDSFRLLHLDN